MRKTIALLLLLMLCAACATCTAAEDALPDEKVTLPESVKALVAQAYPRYEAACFDGWGGDARGQYALVLSNDGNNVLVIAEKGEGDAAYAFTVENSSAVRDGEEIPGVLIDTGGDALYYSYHGYTSDGYYGAYDSYGFFKGADGIWHFAGLIHYDSYAIDATEVTSYLTGVYDGTLRYERMLEDENGNIYERYEYAPIPVSVAYEARFELQNFDIGMLATTPEYGIAGKEGLCEGLLDEGDTLIELDLKPEALAMLVEKPSGARRLRMAAWDGAQYAVRETGDLPPQAGLDTVHASDDEIILNCSPDGRELHCSFRYADGNWLISWVMGDDILSFVYDGVTKESFISSNGSIVYGVLTDCDLFTVDLWNLPLSLEEAVARMDTDAYAYVNNPNPEDRLHLRAKPDRDATSLGKFYNRTPVRVLEKGKTWTRVRIGNETDGLEGYMMTQYLAFGEEKDAVQCAFPQKALIEGRQTGVDMLREPRGGADIVGRFTDTVGDFIIGVVDDDWYVLMRADGSVGYARQSDFWAGNG